MRLLAVLLTLSLLSNALIGFALWFVTKPAKLVMECPFKVKPRHRGPWLI